MNKIIGKIGRSIWGIQRRSFNELHTYLNKKHNQKKVKLQGLMQEQQMENSRIQMRIAFFQSFHSDSAPESSPPGVQISPVVWDESWFETQKHFKIRFKKRLFGLSSKKVHLYLKKLREMQRDELQELRKELGKLLERREQLLTELFSFESMEPSEAAASQEALAEDVHVEEVTVEKIIQQEAVCVGEGINNESIREQWQAQWQAQWQEEWQAQWQAQWQEKLEGEIKDQLLMKLKSHLLTKQPDETEEHWVWEIQEIIKQKILEGQKQIKSRSNVIAFQPKGQRQSMFNLTAVSHEQRLTVNSSDFWGEDIEHFLFQPPTGYAEEGVAYVPDSVEPEIIIEGDGIHQDCYIESNQSPAVTNQAYLLRKKYIVGKLAGADLKDSSGKMIVAKKEIITEQVMNLAEQQGKLAELIVNMMIPGLCE